MVMESGATADGNRLPPVLPGPGGLASTLAKKQGRGHEHPEDQGAHAGRGDSGLHAGLTGTLYPSENTRRARGKSTEGHPWARGAGARNQFMARMKLPGSRELRGC